MEPVSSAMDLCQIAACILLAVHSAPAALLGLDEGDACTALGGTPGTCSRLSDCSRKGDFKRAHPPICRFRGMEPVICCPGPVSERLRVGLKTAQYCEQTKDLCSSGQRRTKRTPQESDNASSTESLRSKPRTYVYNGLPSLPKVHRHMALIGFGAANNKEWGCGGSLITARYILSAAHCAHPKYLGEARWARLGDLDISTETDDARIQDREIVARILHPNYREPQVYNDIAIFKLNADVTFTQWVHPVCLHTETNIPSEIATVTGWGRVDFAGETSSKLLEADLNVFNDTECKRLLPFKDNKTPRGIVTDTMFCAGKLDGSKDACSGDSGGPLVIPRVEKCLKTQIGITSYGSQCGLPDSPGVYTRVSAYIAWIEEVVFYNQTVPA